MSEHTTRKLIEDLAPLDGTANTLANYFALQTFTAQSRLSNHPGTRPGRSDPEFADWMRALDTEAASFAATYVLRVLAEVAPDAADKAADELTSLLECGNAWNAVFKWLPRDVREQLVQAVQAERSEVAA